MFDNVALNVVIGLVLIYLLYSFLVTIVSEILSTWMGIRARLLRVSIERMLNDGFYHKSGRRYGKNLTWWARFVLRTPPGFKQSFAGQFYEYPSIKYLAKIESNRKTLFDHSKPSYISADNFADSLINLLSNKGVGADRIRQISFCLQYNTLHLEAETLDHLRDILNNSGGQLELFRERLMKWFNETQDRTSGWYKSKIKLISFWLGMIIAIAFNVDSIRIAGILSNDKDARDQLVNIGVQLAKDSAGVYREFLRDNGDSARSKTVLDSGLAHITRDINNANFVLGLGWNFDTLREPHSMIISEKTHGNLFTQLAKTWETIKINDTKATLAKKNLNDRADSILGLQQQIRMLMGDTTISKYLLAQSAIDKTLKPDSLRTELNRQTSELQLKIKRLEAERLQLAGDSLSLLRANASLALSNSEFKFPGRETFSEITGKRYFNSKAILVIGTRPCTAWEKFWHWWYCLLVGSFGFVVTALALSLGAPFWFGLLNKLVALRQAGVKPEEKSKEDQKPADLKPTTNIILKNIPVAGETPVDTAMRIYADQIRTEPGVVTVTKGFFKPAANVEECVQANVMDDDTAIELRRKYGNLRIGMNQFVFLNVVVTGKPRLNGGFADGKGHQDRGISNKKTGDNIGSFGCLVKKTDDPAKTFLLTCYHVLNGDKIWANRSVNQDIISNKGTISGNYRGFLSAAMDAAIAELTEQKVIDFYTDLVKTMKLQDIKPVTLDSVFKTRVKIEGFTSKDAKGMIVNHSRPETFEYELGNRRFRRQQIDDLFIINHTMSNSKPTDVGDSGAVVRDENDNVLGIVVGSDFHHSYAIKITTIFDLVGLTLITS